MTKQRGSDEDEARLAESRRILERSSADTDTLGASALARAARHFAGGDAPSQDRIEIWGRRVGRILAVIFAIYLVIMLAEHFAG
jgi:hypothetical protein